MFGNRNAVSIAFEGKDEVSPVVRGIRNSMDGFKRDAKQGFGIAAGFSVMQMGIGALQGVGGALMDAQRAYSALNEAQNRSSGVFKSNAVSIQLWASGLADSFGISERAALDLNAQIGGLLIGMGMGEFEAANLSRTMVELSADLASFANVAGGAEEVAQAFASGLSGEAEPLKRYGIDLREAAVNAWLLANGIEQVNGKWLEADKQRARASIIEETLELQGVIGDSARTMNSSANQARRYDAKVENLNATIGGTVDTVVNFAQAVGITAVDALQGFAVAIDNLDGSVTEAKFWQQAAAAAEDYINAAVEAGTITEEQARDIRIAVGADLDNQRLERDLEELRDDITRQIITVMGPEEFDEFGNSLGSSPIAMDDWLMTDSLSPASINYLAEKYLMPADEVMKRLEVVGPLKAAELWGAAIARFPDDVQAATEWFFDELFADAFAPEADQIAQIEAEAGGAGTEVGTASAAAMVDGVVAGAEVGVQELKPNLLTLFDGLVQIAGDTAADFEWGDIPKQVNEAIESTLEGAGDTGMDLLGGLFDNLFYEKIEKGPRKGEIRNVLTKGVREQINTAKQNLRYLANNPDVTKRIERLWSDFGDWLYGGEGRKGFLERKGIEFGDNTGLDFAMLVAGDAQQANVENWGIVGNDVVSAFTGGVSSQLAADISSGAIPSWLSEILYSEGVPPEFLATMAWTVTIGGDVAKVEDLLARASGGTITIDVEAANHDHPTASGNRTGGARKLAMGGDFGPEELLMVGENGPEFLRTGKRGGTVYPNHAIGSNGPVAVYLDGRLVGQLLDERLGSRHFRR